MTGTYEPTFPASPHDESLPPPVPAGPPDRPQGVLVIAADGSVRLDPEVHASDHLTQSCGVLGKRSYLVEEGQGPVLTSTVYWALQARELATGTGCGCSTAQDFARKELVLPGGPRWDEAVGTALLGDWIKPLFSGERLDKTVYSKIKTEAHTIHRELVPLWQRRVRGARVGLLNAPVGENLTLLDLVAAKQPMDDLVFEAAFENERLNTILARFSPPDRRVVIVRYTLNVTWAEAARYAGESAPEKYGERVRRRLKRLADQYTARARAAAATRAGA